MLQPFRRLLPAISGIDLSPILAFLALRLLVFVVENLVYAIS
ncbi:MAG: YggT family protein [Burkholderiaceae bacterium]